MIAGALWVGLILAAAGDLSPAPAPTAPPASAAAPEPAPPALAAPAAPTVAVTAPPPEDVVLVEASTRIRAELAASGISSTEITCTRGGAADGAGCPAVTAGATISLEREDGVAVIDVLLILPGGPELRRRVPVPTREGGDDPSVLAVRAVELLRDLRPSARPPAAVQRKEDDEAPARPQPPPPPPPPPLLPRWQVAIGPAALASLQPPTVGPAFGLALSAGVLVARRTSIFLTVSGLYSTALHVESEGSASLEQGLGTLELRHSFEVGAVQPFAALLTGVNYVREAVTGGASTASTMAAVFGGGGGISFEVQDRFTLAFEAQVFVTSPAVVLDIGGQLAGRLGTPSLLLLANAGFVLP